MLCKVLQSSFIIEWCGSLDCRRKAAPISHLSDPSVNCSFVLFKGTKEETDKSLSDLSVNCSFVRYEEGHPGKILMSQWPIGQLLICTSSLKLNWQTLNCLSDLSDLLGKMFLSGSQMLCKVLQSSFIIEWCGSLDYRLLAVPFSHLSDLSVNCSFVLNSAIVREINFMSQ